MTEQRVLAAWNDQNPALVKHLEHNGTLKTRLAEAREMASGVRGHSIQNGLNVMQAEELALDAVALERAKDEDDEDL